jgi:pyrophosphatase PpaX
LISRVRGNTDDEQAVFRLIGPALDQTNNCFSIYLSPIIFNSTTLRIEDIHELSNPTRAILFDLDGTLIDTTDLIMRCFHHSWRTVCGLEHSREAILTTFGIPLREAMQRLLAQTNGLEPADVEALVDRLLLEYRIFNVANHDELAFPFAGVRQVLEQLRASGYRIGVVTSKGRELATRGLQLCALSDLIDAAVFLEDTTTHKPQPEPILAALARLNTRADRAVYVGDSFHDIVAGRRAGVRTVAALWGPMPRAELEREQPDYMAESITQLLEIFAAPMSAEQSLPIEAEMS